MGILIIGSSLSILVMYSKNIAYVQINYVRKKIEREGNRDMVVVLRGRGVRWRGDGGEERGRYGEKNGGWEKGERG